MGLDLTVSKFKLGDGSTAWNTPAFAQDDVDLLPLANTWAALNTFDGGIHVEGYTNIAIPNNGNGAAAPTSAIVNNVTQTITGAGDAFWGQRTPSMVEDSGTYNLDVPSALSAGALFQAQTQVNFSGTPAFGGLAGAWFTVQAHVDFDKTTTAAITHDQFNVDVLTQYSNTGGTGAYSVKETALNHRPDFATAITGLKCVTAVSTPVTLAGTATVDDSIGFQVKPRSHGTDNNVGFMYSTGSSLPHDGLEYAVYANEGIVSAQGGMAHNCAIFSNGGSNTADETHHFIILTVSGTGLVLPAVSAVAAGTTYRVLNSTGGTETITSASGFRGVSRTVLTNTSRTFINSGSTWESLN